MNVFILFKGIRLKFQEAALIYILNGFRDAHQHYKKRFQMVNQYAHNFEGKKWVFWGRNIHKYQKKGLFCGFVFVITGRDRNIKPWIYIKVLRLKKSTYGHIPTK